MLEFQNQKNLFPEISEWMKGFCKISIFQGFKEKSHMYTLWKKLHNMVNYIYYMDMKFKPWVQKCIYEKFM